MTVSTELRSVGERMDSRLAPDFWESILFSLSSSVVNHRLSCYCVVYLPVPSLC